MNPLGQKLLSLLSDLDFSFLLSLRQLVLSPFSCFLFHFLLSLLKIKISKNC
jgi:hypothetical protein